MNLGDNVLGNLSSILPNPPFSHFRIYKDVDQCVNSDNYDMGQHVTDWDPINKGLETRDLKWIYHGTLMKKVR